MRRFFAILAAFVVATACTEYTEQDTLPLEKQSINVGVEQDTRAFFEALDGAYRHYWEAGDDLSVFYYSAVNSHFTLSQGADTQLATFEGEAVAGELTSICALYPYREGNAVDGAIATVEFPATQTLRADKHSYDKQALVMAASGSGEESLKMLNLSAFVNVSLTGSATITKVELRALNGESITGLATVNLGAAEPVVTMSDSEGSNVVTLNCNSTLTSTATEIFVAVAPQSLTRGFEVTIYDGDGMYMRRRHSAAVELERNTVYRMPALEYKAASSAIALSDVKYAQSAEVSAEYRYTIYGSGFQSDDKIRLCTGNTEYICTVTKYYDCVTFTIPAELVSGTYTVDVVRGSDSLTIGEMKLNMNDIPQADMLDVVFNADGSATDNSAKMMYVEYSPSPNLFTYYESYQNSYMARFNNALYSDITSGFYKVNFQSNASFCAELADGHTLETIIKLNTVHDGSDEAKWFSCHDTGGTGFLLTKSAKGKTITFLPRVGSGYVWTMSNVEAEVGEYYHVVGVWSKSLGCSTVYVNGVKYNSVATSGNFVMPKNDAAYWFAIGGDSRKNVPSSPQNCWNGDIGMARIYDSALTDEQVAQLWNEAKRDRSTSTIRLTDVEHFSRAEVKINSRYSVYALGLQSGDKLKFESVSATSAVQPQCDVESGRIVATIPAEMLSGLYNIYVVRGEEQSFVGKVEFTVTDNPREYFAPQIVAHRGVCNNGEPDNSMASFKSAQAIGGIYGTEFDIFVTADDRIVLHHDKNTDSGINIETSTYSQLANVTLSNGEKLPLFEDILEQAKTTPNLRLIVEVKDHANPANSIRCTELAVEMIKAQGLENQVDFISFDYDVCKRAAQLLPDITVGYLGGNIAPAQVYADGINNIDYKWDTQLLANPHWIDEAHQLGMTVNAWTVNAAAKIVDVYAAGVDYITTDEVARAKTIFAKVFVEHP